MFNSMIRSSTHRFLIWYRKNHNYCRSRRISDHRATALAMKQILTGALQNAPMTGSQLTRAE